MKATAHAPLGSRNMRVFLGLLALAWVAASVWVGVQGLLGPPGGPVPVELPFVEVTPRLSGDGRRLAFEAVRGSLERRPARLFGRREAERGRAGFTDVVLYDLEEGRGEVISRRPDGSPANGSSYAPDLAATGDEVAFASEASDLVAEDRNAAADVFVWREGRLARVGAPEPRTGLDSSFMPALDAAGRRVAFSTAGLGSREKRRWRGLVVADLPAGTPRPVPRLGQPLGPVYGRPSLSRDGERVAFASAASLPLDPWQAYYLEDNKDRVRTNGIDVFLFPVRTGLPGQDSLVSAAPDGSRGDGPSYSPCLAGNLCAFTSLAGNLVPGDSNGRFDVFVRDLEAGATSLESRGREGPADDSSFEPSLSADGRFLAFTSYASNLAEGDGNGTSDVFLKDRLTGEVRLVSRGPSGAPGDGPSYSPALSADGRRLAFVTRATDLEASPVPPGQIYVWDRDAGGLTRVLPERIR